LHLQRSISVDYIRGALIPAGKLGQHIILLAHGEEHARRAGIVGDSANQVFLVDSDEAFRLIKRQWLDQQCVDDGKYSRVGADAQRNGEGCHEREAGTPAEKSMTEDNILKKCPHVRSPSAGMMQIPDV